MKTNSAERVMEQEASIGNQNQPLSENELLILALIREGKAKSIIIKFSNQKPCLVEIEKEVKLETESRFSEILSKKKYQELVLKTNEGRIVYSLIKTQIKL